MKEFFDAFDSPGGHLALLLVLFLIGVWLSVCGYPESKDVMLPSLGALFAVLRYSPQDPPKVG